MESKHETTRMSVNVTFAPDESVAGAFLKWAREVYIPAVNSADGCSGARLLRVLSAGTTGDGAVSDAYAVQFDAASPEVAVRWLEEGLPLALGRFFDRHSPESLPLFATVMEVIG